MRIDKISWKEKKAKRRNGIKKQVVEKIKEDEYFVEEELIRSRVRIKGKGWRIALT